MTAITDELNIVANKHKRLSSLGIFTAADFLVLINITRGTCIRRETETVKLFVMDHRERVGENERELNEYTEYPAHRHPHTHTHSHTQCSKLL